MRNATLVFHAHIAIATAILFPFQMAILRGHITYEHALWKQVCAMKIEKIDAHAKYDQKRRGGNSQGDKYLPTGPQYSFSVGNGRLTSSNITHNFAEASCISTSVGGLGSGGYDTYLTVDRSGGIESKHVNDYGNQCAHACQGVNLPKDSRNDQHKAMTPAQCD